MDVTNSVDKRVKRLIISVDESKCVGCGKCIDACLTGALALINGKAKLVDETLCDGFGSCIAACRYNALRIEYKDALEFNWNILSNVSLNDWLNKLRKTAYKTSLEKHMNKSKFLLNLIVIS